MLMKSLWELLVMSYSLLTECQQMLSHYLQISKRENWHFGNVVPSSFHFYTRLITQLHGKTSYQLLI